MTRQQLMQNISAAELQQWMLLYRLEPWGDRRRDINTAQLAQLLVQLMASKESSQGVTIDTFLIDWWGEIKARQARDVWGRFKVLAEQINKGFESDGPGTGPKS